MWAGVVFVLMTRFPGLGVAVPAYQDDQTDTDFYSINTKVILKSPNNTTIMENLIRVRRFIIYDDSSQTLEPQEIHNFEGLRRHVFVEDEDIPSLGDNIFDSYADIDFYVENAVNDTKSGDEGFKKRIYPRGIVVPQLNSPMSIRILTPATQAQPWNPTDNIRKTLMASRIALPVPVRFLTTGIEDQYINHKARRWQPQFITKETITMLNRNVQNNTSKTVTVKHWSPEDDRVGTTTTQPWSLQDITEHIGTIQHQSPQDNKEKTVKVQHWSPEDYRVMPVTALLWSPIANLQGEEADSIQHRRIKDKTAKAFRTQRWSQENSRMEVPTVQHLSPQGITEKTTTKQHRSTQNNKTKTVTVKSWSPEGNRMETLTVQRWSPKDNIEEANTKPNQRNQNATAKAVTKQHLSHEENGVEFVTTRPWSPMDNTKEKVPILHRIPQNNKEKTIRVQDWNPEENRMQSITTQRWSFQNITKNTVTTEHQSPKKKNPKTVEVQHWSPENNTVEPVRTQSWSPMDSTMETVTIQHWSPQDNKVKTVRVQYVDLEDNRVKIVSTHRWSPMNSTEQIKHKSPQVNKAKIIAVQHWSPENKSTEPVTVQRWSTRDITKENDAKHWISQDNKAKNERIQHWSPKDKKVDIIATQCSSPMPNTEETVTIRHRSTQGKKEKIDRIQHWSPAEDSEETFTMQSWKPMDSTTKTVTIVNWNPQYNIEETVVMPRVTLPFAVRFLTKTIKAKGWSPKVNTENTFDVVYWEPKNNTVTVQRWSPTDDDLDLPLIEIRGNPELIGLGPVSKRRGSSTTTETAASPGDSETNVDSNENHITEDFKQSLMDHGVQGRTGFKENNISANSTTPSPYDFSNSSLVAKCFVCGLKHPKLPGEGSCSDAFDSDLLPLWPIDLNNKWLMVTFKKYCQFLDVQNFVENPSEPQAVYGRFTGGCGVRWTDVSGLYTQRTCRIRHEPLMGKHYASKRMALLELALVNVENGCIISPMASLVPLSRGISLYARFYACVCTGDWCNRAEGVAQWNANMMILTYWLSKI